MIYRRTLRADGDDEWTPASHIALVSDITLIIPPMSIGRITHDIEIKRESDDKTIFVMSESGMFCLFNLIIPARAIEDGEVVTHALNMSQRKVKIRRGQPIAQLIAL